jgi:threonine aldolase
MPHKLNVGRQVVAVAGTAVALVTSPTAARSVAITAETDNTDIVVVGDSAVVAALATRKGTPLSAGQTTTITLQREDGKLDLSKIFIDAVVNTEGVTFTWL